MNKILSAWNHTKRFMFTVDLRKGFTSVYTYPPAYIYIHTYIHTIRFSLFQSRVTQTLYSTCGTWRLNPATSTYLPYVYIHTHMRTKVASCA